MDDRIPELADAIYRERVQRARASSVAQRFLAGGDLFDYACSITLSGIRHQNPTASFNEVMAELRHRLALARKLEAMFPELEP